MVKKCIYCEAPMEEKKARLLLGEIADPPGSLVVYGRATIEHIIPTSRGGNHSAKNKVWACAKCNSFKSNLMPEEFVEYLKMVRIKGDAKFSQRLLDRMIENAQALVTTIAPYRAELFLAECLIQKPVLYIAPTPGDLSPTFKEFLKAFKAEYQMPESYPASMPRWIYNFLTKKHHNGMENN